VAARCGDGIVWQGVEECDDGNDSDTDGCPTNCLAARCGDGIVWQGVEECDDGNDSDTDACLTSCVAASCGDGFVWAGNEECDDGDGSNTNGCLTSCKTASCGDGFVWQGVEECDDGNTTAGDTCSPSCAVESLPVLHWIDNVNGGWSSEIITYANDPHAPSEPIVGAANVQQRDEAYFFTRSSFHLMSLPSRSWIDHGALTARFDDAPAASFTSCYGVSWDTSSDADILFLSGMSYQLYHVSHLTGSVTKGDSGTLPWDLGAPHVPTPSDIKAMWIALENDEGWVDCNPYLLCGASQTQTGPYTAHVTDQSYLHINESGSSSPSPRRARRGAARSARPSMPMGCSM
jgi:cysteine-rich repeat protein